MRAVRIHVDVERGIGREEVMEWSKIDNFVCIAIVALAVLYFGAHILVGFIIR